jgi:hypothetical protein
VRWLRRAKAPNLSASWLLGKRSRAREAGSSSLHSIRTCAACPPQSKAYSSANVKQNGPHYFFGMFGQHLQSLLMVLILAVFDQFAFASKRARAFFPSLAATAMLSKKTGGLSRSPPTSAVNLPLPCLRRVASQLHDDRIVSWVKFLITHAV